MLEDKNPSVCGPFFLECCTITDFFTEVMKHVMKSTGACNNVKNGCIQFNVHSCRAEAVLGLFSGVLLLVG